jgi:hypothetical protein
VTSVLDFDVVVDGPVGGVWDSEDDYYSNAWWELA